MQESSLSFAKAIADETRQKIMSALCCRWLSVSEVVTEIGNVTQPTISHHLSVLRETDLVRVREEGKNTFYILNQERVASCCGRLIQVFAPESDAARLIQPD